MGSSDEQIGFEKRRWYKARYVKKQRDLEWYVKASDIHWTFFKKMEWHCTKQLEKRNISLSSTKRSLVLF